MLRFAQAITTTLLMACLGPPLLACAPTPGPGASSSVQGPAVVAGPNDAEEGGDERSEAMSDGKSAAVYDSKADGKSDSKADDKSDSKIDSKSDSKFDSKSDYEEKPESADPLYADGKNYKSHRGKASADGERPRGAHEVPIARRDDLGTPGQEAPLNVVAAYLAAADANDRQRAFALMTAKCAERERTWEKSFSAAIFDRGYRFQVVRLMGNDTQDENAEIRLRVVFLDHEGEPDNEGMRFNLLRRDGQWWIDEVH